MPVSCSAINLLSSGWHGGFENDVGKTMLYTPSPLSKPLPSSLRVHLATRTKLLPSETWHAL